MRTECKRDSDEKRWRAFKKYIGAEPHRPATSSETWAKKQPPINKQLCSPLKMVNYRTDQMYIYYACIYGCVYNVHACGTIFYVLTVAAGSMPLLILFSVRLKCVFHGHRETGKWHGRVKRGRSRPFQLFATF